MTPTNPQQEAQTSEARHTPPGWPKTPFQMLERIEKRWMELEARDISNHDFRCLMSDVSQFVCDYKTFETDLFSALQTIAQGVTSDGAIIIAKAALAKAEKQP